MESLNLGSKSLGQVRRQPPNLESIEQFGGWCLIIFATLSALLWSLLRPLLDGGPDEWNHFLQIVYPLSQNWEWPMFKGYPPGTFGESAVRAQVAYELTPNISALIHAFVLNLAGLPEMLEANRWGRIVSVAFYPLTLIISWRIFKLVFVDDPLIRLLGLTVMVTVPQFMLVHSYITNDSPAIFFSTVTIYLALRARKYRFDTTSVLLLSVAVGFVMLHKYNGFMVLPGVVALVVWEVWRDPYRLLRIAALGLIVVLLVAGWWYVRGVVVYGDLLGIDTTRVAVDASGPAPIPPAARGLNPIQFLQETNWLAENYATFWAGYGLQKLKLPGGVYIAFLLVLLASIAGMFFRFVSASSKWSSSLDRFAIVWMTAMFLGLLAMSFWSSYTVDVALHGRYLYPQFVSFVVLIMAGFTGLLVLMKQRLAFALVAVAMLSMLSANVSYLINIVVPDMYSPSMASVIYVAV
tara:strand:- start:233 stop:1627 length:1395 start_codon:yes stop_codon:yes gene_type:complete